MPHHIHHAHALHQHQQPAIHDSTFFFVGPFDDETSFSLRGPQPAGKPTGLSLVTTCGIAPQNAASLAASPLSEHSEDDGEDDDDYFYDEDYAVLGDDDGPAADELPPSPRRRHSGAMSISEEDLPFCYDREALRRDTAAHRARHHHHHSGHHHHHHLRLRQQQQQQQQQHLPATFAAHETWDAETDGPSMALWVPDGGPAGGERKRRRVERSETAPSPGRAQERPEVPPPRGHSSEMEGPMMALWGL